MFHNGIGLFVLVAFFYNSEAESIDELKQNYMEIIKECSKSYPISSEDLALLQNKQMPNKDSVTCLFACVYKASGMMNDKGELWLDGVNEISRKYLSNDPVTMNKSVEFAEACGSVNNVPVNDGNRGCDRAALIFQCTVEKASYFDFV